MKEDKWYNLLWYDFLDWWDKLWYSYTSNGIWGPGSVSYRKFKKQNLTLVISIITFILVLILFFVK